MNEILSDWAAISFKPESYVKYVLTFLKSYYTTRLDFKSISK